MPSTMTIAELRQERGETLEEFAEAIGIASKGRASAIERGVEACSFDIALKVEELSQGRIDAAELNQDVAKARTKVA